MTSQEAITAMQEIVTQYDNTEYTSCTLCIRRYDVGWQYYTIYGTYSITSMSKEKFYSIQEIAEIAVILKFADGFIAGEIATRLINRGFRETAYDTTEHVWQKV